MTRPFISLCYFKLSKRSIISHIKVFFFSCKNYHEFHDVKYVVYKTKVSEENSGQ